MAAEQEEVVVAEGDEQTPEGPTLEALQKANKSQDRVIAELQAGKRLPKWAQDAGFQTRADLDAALKSAAAPESQPDNPPMFDVKQYLDEDGRMTPEGYAAQAQFQAELARRAAREELGAAREAEAMQNEIAFINEAGQTAGEALVVEGGDADIVAGLVEGLTARTIQGHATQRQVLQVRDDVLVPWINRVVNKEIARRAQAAQEADADEAPAGSPGDGAGQPKVPDNEEPPATHEERVAQAQGASRQAFVKRRAASAG